MKKLKWFGTFLILSVFVLVGCSTEEATPSFMLMEMASVQWDDEETPVRYVVNNMEAKDQVIVYRNEMISETVFDQTEETFELEGASVTDDEIVIEYDGQTVTFERLSSSVVQNEDRQQYEYISFLEE